MKKKFIITADEKIANYMIASGFKLVSNIANSYTFVNEKPANFNFESIDKSKLAFTNILSM